MRAMIKRIGMLAATALLLTATPTELAAEPRLQFEGNVGQASLDAEYLGRGPGYVVALHDGSYTLALRSAPKTPRWMRTAWERFAASEPAPWVVSMDLTGASDGALSVALEPATARSHYFQAAKRTQNVRRYGRIRYGDVYPGIDVEYYGAGREMEFDFIVAPGSDPRQIRMRFRGASEMIVDDAGDLVLRSEERELRHQRPTAFQEIRGERVEVACEFVIEGSAVALRLADYDAYETLVIDPRVVWSQTLPGVGTDRFFAVAAGPDGTVYAAGTTESIDIPAPNGVLGAYQGGRSDAYVAQFAQDGTLLNATFIGGSGEDDASGIAVNADGAVYIIGSTDSTNLPTTLDSLQPVSGGGLDAFVTVLTSDLSELVASTFLGGSSSEIGVALAFDTISPDIFVTGATLSSDFASAGTAFPQQGGADSDVYLGKLDPHLSRLRAMARYGGDGRESPARIRVSPSGEPILAGSTDSSNLPSTADAFQRMSGGGIDSFVTAYTSNLDLFYSTYFGGPGDDVLHDFDYDPMGNAYLGGGTTGGLPTTANAAMSAYPGGPTSGFIARFPSLGGLGFAVLPEFADPIVTYTGDENRNSVLGLRFLDHGGRMRLGLSKSTFLDEHVLVEGCGDEELQGPVAKMEVLHVPTGLFVQVPASPPNETCLPEGDILGVGRGAFPFRDNLLGSGVWIVGSGLDGSVFDFDLAEPATTGGANLDLVKRRFLSAKKVRPGGRLEFQIEVRNLGPDTATNVRVTDALPPGFSVTGIDAIVGSCSQSGSEVVCDLGSMLPGSFRPIRIRGTAPPALGSYSNVAQATASNLIGPTRTDSTEFQVRIPVRLQLRKTVVSSDANGIEYLIEIENKSNAFDAANVRMDEILPAELSNVEAETERGTCNLNPADPLIEGATGSLNCTLSFLAPGDIWFIHVRGQPTTLRAQISNSAMVDSDQSESFSLDAAPLNKVDGSTSADVWLSVSFSGDASPTACRLLGVFVGNQGPDAAIGVRVEVSQTSTATISTVDPLCTLSSGRVICDLGQMPPYFSRNLKFLACAEQRAESAYFGGLITSGVLDPDPSNNTDGGAAPLDPAAPKLSEEGFGGLSATTPAKGAEISPGGFVSSSAFHRPMVGSRGSDPSLFGTGFADGNFAADAVPLPLELGGVSVEINGFPAPLLFVSPTQINFQTPWELPDDALASVVVRSNSGESLPAKVYIAPYNPGIFTTLSNGSGQASVLIAGTASIAGVSGSLPGARPVKIGEFISIFATGLGAVENQPITGDLSPSGALARTKTAPKVSVGAVDAPVSFSGLAPGFVGLYQVNAQIAEGTPSGDAVDLLLTIGGVPSNQVTIAVDP